MLAAGAAAGCCLLLSEWFGGLGQVCWCCCRVPLQVSLGWCARAVELACWCHCRVLLQGAAAGCCLIVLRKFLQSERVRLVLACGAARVSLQGAAVGGAQGAAAKNCFKILQDAGALCCRCVLCRGQLQGTTVKGLSAS